MDIGLRKTEFKFELSNLLAARPWASYLNVSHCKMGIITNIFVIDIWAHRYKRPSTVQCLTLIRYFKKNNAFLLFSLVNIFLPLQITVQHVSSFPFFQLHFAFPFSVLWYWLLSIILSLLLIFLSCTYSCLNVKRLYVFRLLETSWQWRVKSILKGKELDGFNLSTS